jgi:hypothetical protein
MPDDSWYNEGVDWGYDDGYDIVVTGYPAEDYSISDALDAFGGDDGSSDDDGGGGTGGPETETLTNEEAARQFAENNVQPGPGFDPNNPAHVAALASARELVKDMAQKILDDRSTITVTGRNGDTYTESQIENGLANVTVVIGTQNLVGRDGTQVAAGLDSNNRTIRIDIDSQDFTDLQTIFGSLTEVINFLVLHEVGHVLDNRFSSSQETNARDRETEATDIALRLLDELGLASPTDAEVNRFYNGPPTNDNNDDSFSYNDYSDPGFGYGNYGNYHYYYGPYYALV